MRDDSNRDAARLAGRALRGTLWLGLAEILRVGSQALLLGIGPLLLAPDRFGLASAVLVVISSLDMLSRPGIRQAVIARRSVDDELLDNAWSALLLRGVLLSAVMALGAPALARLFGAETGPLVPMLRAGSLCLLFQGLQSTGPMQLSRVLDFRRQLAFQALPGALAAAVAVGGLWWTGDPWAIVAARLVQYGSEALLSWQLVPRRHRFRLRRSVVGGLVRYGRWVLGSSLLATAVVQFDNVLVGRLLGLSALALYKLAYDLSQLPVTRLAHLIQRAVVAAIARTPERSAAVEVFRRITRATFLLILPANALLAAFVPDLVALFKPGWEAMVPLVRILCLAAVLRSMAVLAGAVFLGSGRSWLGFAMNLPRAVLLLGAIAPLAVRYGFDGVAWLVVGATATSVLVCGWALARYPRFPVGRLTLQLLPGLGFGGLWAATGLALRSQLPAGPWWAAPAVVGGALVALAAGRVLGWSPRQELAVLRGRPEPVQRPEPAR